MVQPVKRAPSYAIASVDNALRLASMLQLEGRLTVSEASQRLDVANSTAHRLLAMLVYRDFAVQEADRSYRAGPVLELASHSQSAVSHLRAAALPHLHRVVDVLGESANLSIRTGATVRFVASVESPQALRVGTREGMVFPAHRTTGGLVLLAALTAEELRELYPAGREDDPGEDRPDLRRLGRDLARVRRNGFALNDGRSERGVVAIGVPVAGADGVPVACLSVSLPSARYDRQDLPRYVSVLTSTASELDRQLT